MTDPPRHRLLVARSNPATTALQLLAYAHAFPDAEYTLLLTGDDEAGGAIIRRLCADLGMEVIDLATASSREFDCVIVHSFAHRDKLSGLLSSLTHDEVWFYADGFRNDFIFPAGTDLSDSVLIYFGWHLDDVSLREVVSRPAREVRVVPLDALRLVWNLVNSTVPDGLGAPPGVAPDELLIAVRYWGHSELYQTFRFDTVVDAISDLVIPSDIRRVIIKHDARTLVHPQELIGRIRLRLRADVELVEWQDSAESRALLGSLDVLDRHLFSHEWIQGHFFGFDGTPNVAVGVTQPQAVVHWPDVELIDTYFYDPTTRHMVEDSVTWQQSIVAQFRAGKATGLSSAHNGSFIRELFDRPITLNTAIDKGFAHAMIDHIASAVELAPDPDLVHVVAWVDEWRRARIEAERNRQENATLVDSLRHDLAAQQSVVEAQTAEISATRVELEAAQSALRDATAHLEASQSHHDRLLAVSAAEVDAAVAAQIQAESVAAQAQAVATQAEAAAARAMAATQEVLASRSWRVTRPIRAVSSHLHRLRPARGTVADEDALRENP